MRRTLALWTVGLLILTLAPEAMAQLPKKPGPPPRPDTMIVYGSYIVAAVLLGCSLVGAFKPSKRTHQD